MSFGESIDFDELYQQSSGDVVLQEKLNITHDNQHETNFSDEDDSDGDSDDRIDDRFNQGVSNVLNRLQETYNDDLPFSGCDDINVLDQKDKQILDDLKLENQRLKKQLRVIDPTVYFCDGNGPAMEIIYLNNEFARIYKNKIEDFIWHIQESHNRMGGCEDIPDVSLKSSNVALSVKANKLLSEEASLYIQSSQTLGCSQIFDAFIIDGMGWPLVDDTPDKTPGYDYPSFECEDDEMKLELIDEEDADKCPQPTKFNSRACFNCGGTHSIADCKKPKNMQMINASKAKFQAQKEESKAKNTRYHESKSILDLAANNGIESNDNNEDNCPQKSKFIPGILSQNLRDALGLRDDQLPSYVYLMRELGYPPGWMEMIKSETSGLSMVGRNGFDEHLCDDEEGEIRERQTESYNEKNIIEYPGFNVDVPENMIDEALEPNSNLPRMKRQHHKSSMKESIKELNEKDRSDTKRQLSEESCNRGQNDSKKQKTTHNNSLNDSNDAGHDISDLNNSQLYTPGLSISFEFSTPLNSESISKIDCLPATEKWADGSTEHIPYENLPGATGTFAKLNDTLKRNRNKSK